MAIRPASWKDDDAILAILLPIIRAGETYALDRDLTADQALGYWHAQGNSVFVAEVDGRILGSYFCRANMAGGGRHVANCAYATHEQARGRGIARAMAAHSFDFAWGVGFRAMMFNFVVASNVRAVRLWLSLGFEQVGRLPGAFDHPTLGEVDALVLHRPLGP
ncbi:GNAT family N-acetyltransferase [Nostoc sp. 3335mG]|nr:GNAT family N-acetyltransferase [Nostoc sp. 3335mG]